MKYKLTFGEILKKYNLLIVLAVFIIVSAILSPSFLTGNNLLNMFRQCSIPGIMAIGMTLVIILGGIDLSVGAVAALSGMVTSVMVAANIPIWLSIITGIVTGVAMGLLTGFFCAVTKLPDFIVTLASMEVARGLAMLITQGSPVFGLPKSFGIIGGGKIGGIVPVSGVIWIALTVIVALVLRYTNYGRSLYAIGGNKLAAKYSGIAVTRNKLITYAVCAALSAFAGIMVASWLGAGQPTACQGYELDAIAASVIGGASLSGGVGGVFGTVGGVFLLQMITNIFNLVGIPSFYQRIAKGVIIVAALLLNKLVISRKK